MNVTQQSVKLPNPPAEVFYQAVPPETGYGSPEDSMASVLALQPKPPKFDMKKMFKQDMHCLRFNARLVSTEPDDESRTFIVSFYCGDETAQVYEVCDKNSGRIGGRFMERKKQRNPVSGNHYRECDFVVGRTVQLAGFKFMLLSSDEYTQKYQEDNGDVFPESSVSAIIRKIKAPAKNYPDLMAYANDLMARLDTNKDKFIDANEFEVGLRKMGIIVSVKELQTLMRNFDTNGDGRISLQELFACLNQH
jgi:hypothetical protein